MTSALDAINRAFNEAIAEDFPEFRPRQASYRYYLNKKTKDKYFYTTGKMMRKGSLRYISGIYRYKKTKKLWSATKLAGHAKKRAAMARALKLYKEKA